MPGGPWSCCLCCSSSATAAAWAVAATPGARAASKAQTRLFGGIIVKLTVASCPPFRASDDLEKTNTTYAEDSQPTQGRSGLKIRLNISSGAQGSLPVSPSLRNHHPPGRIRRPLSRQLSRWRVRAVRLHWLYWPQSLIQ